MDPRVSSFDSFEHPFAEAPAASLESRTDIANTLAELRSLPADCTPADVTRLAASLVTGMKDLPDSERASFEERTLQIGSTLVSSARAYQWLMFAHSAIRQNPFSSLADPLRASLLQHRESLLVDLSKRGDAGGQALLHLVHHLPAAEFAKTVSVAQANGTLGPLGAAFRKIAGSIGRSDPTVLLELAKALDPAIADLALDCAPHLSPREAREVVRLGLAHPSPEVRKRALRRVSFFPEGDQTRYLATALSDADDEIAGLAAARLARVARGSSLGPLLRWMESPRFEKSELEDQASIYQALAQTGRPEALIALEQRLLRRPKEAPRLLFRKQDPGEHEEVLPVIVDALVKANISAAWDVLLRGSRSSHSVVKKLCADALEHWTQRPS